MKPQHQIFIIKMIKYGDKVQAYRAAYPKCTNDETARKSAERILRHHPEVAAEIEEATAYMRQRTYAEAYREHVERQKTPLLSMMKRREILAQIATCQMKVGRFVKDGGRYIMLFEDPRPRDIMQAIQTDAKMEDACNRMRNCNDPFFSQFYIYIDGRPCDQPHLPPDPNLPPGIYMLPRRRKNQIEKSGIISEQNLLKDSFPVIREGGTNAVSDGRVDEGSTSAQYQNPGIISEQNTTQHLPLQGAGGQNSGSNLGTSSMPQIENQNSGIKTEQNNHTSPHPGDLGGLLAPEQNQIEKSGITRGTSSMPQIENQNSGIKTEHLSQDSENQITSPHPGDLGVPLAPEQNTQNCPPLGGDRGALAQNQNSGIILEQNTSPHSGDLGVALAPDPLAASFYKREQQARASAPPPHILTPDEVKELDEEYARKRRNEKPVKPSTFGKMYFKEKGIDYDNLE